MYECVIVHMCLNMGCGVQVGYEYVPDPFPDQSPVETAASYDGETSTLLFHFLHGGTESPWVSQKQSSPIAAAGPPGSGEWGVGRFIKYI